MTTAIGVSHPTGNENVRQVLRALSEVDALAWFATTLGSRQGAGGVVTSRLLARRSYDVPRDKLRTSPLRETRRLLAQRTPLRGLTSRQAVWGIDHVGTQLDARAARMIAATRPTAIWCYEDVALAQQRAAAAFGARSILELPYAYYGHAHTVIRAEQQRNPLWGPTLTGLADAQPKLERKDAELEAADTIVVPSGQVLRSLPAHLLGKAVLVPYGCPAVPASRPREQSERLRVLYVGRLSADKGLAYLCRAWRAVSDLPIDMTVIGSLPTHVPDELDRFLRSVDYRGTQPRPAVLDAMAQHDVFVMPSLVEGRSLAVLEAASRGLVPVVTQGSGADDLVTPQAGTVIEAASSESLADALRDLVSLGAAELADARIAVLEVAAQASWDRFRGEVQALVARQARPT